MNSTSVPINRLCASALIFTLTCASPAAAQSAVQATLQPAAERKAAPNFTLKDASGKPVTLKDYRGKIVLLDFWATWCHGCKEEIPWFSDFQRMYRAKGFVVVGVSMDEGGWSVVKPFLADTKVPYPVLLGDDPTSQRYGIQSLPDTFLIDRHGNIAAAYTGLVDKDNLQANIEAAFSKRSRITTHVAPQNRTSMSRDPGHLPL
jgi:peroxiredoxin